ncbi:KH domain-containing protein [candidate division WWE3 bacterium]|nr:KH domain-containing protein [candidate division WWE3 bacterium]
MDSVVKTIEQKLGEILKYLKVNPKYEIEEEGDTCKVFIDGDDLSFLIGYRGESLNGLQHILTSIINKDLAEWKHIIVDINGYRDSRKLKIEDMVRNFIDRVRFHNSDVEMPPMNSFERRWVHMFVADYPDIVSESAGEGNTRRVVLKLKVR